jgi:hypothetical protein
VVIVQGSTPVGPVTTGQFPAFPQAAPANPAPIGVPNGPDVVTPTGANVREPNPASLSESQMQIQCLTYGVGCY